MRKSINRRLVLKTGTVLVAATVAGVVQAQSVEINPDAELQALYIAYRKAEAIGCDAARKADFLGLPKEVQQPLDEAVDKAWRAMNRVVNRIAREPARGLAGLEIKLLVWSEVTGQFARDETCCAQSALRDLKRLNDTTKSMNVVRDQTRTGDRL